MTRMLRLSAMVLIALAGVLPGATALAQRATTHHAVHHTGHRPHHRGHYYHGHYYRYGYPGYWWHGHWYPGHPRHHLRPAHHGHRGHPPVRRTHTAHH